MFRNPSLLVMLALLSAGASAQLAPIPMNEEIGGDPFVIQDKWVIGGTGSWDYMALDPVARQLFITHQTKVQVVDLATGLVTGTINGFSEAHAVVLDRSEQFGYVSDGKANAVQVFDRRSLRIESTIHLNCSPRSIVLAPDQDGLLAICGAVTPPPAAEPARHLATPPDMRNRPRPDRRGETSTRALPRGNSQVALIDIDTRKVLAYLSAPGDFHIGQADNDGDVYVTVGPVEQDEDGPYSRKFSGQALARIDITALAQDARPDNTSHPARSGSSAPFYWTASSDRPSPYVTYLRLSPDCENPQGLAIDSHNRRVFVACNNQVLLVVDAVRGDTIKSLTIGPGTDAIAYDDFRGLIFTANGGGYGSLTVVRTHVSDSYAVVQNLPTMERARTLATDPSTGRVYLVTDLHGVDLAHPSAGGIGKLKLEPVDGSFQILVIGN